MPIKILISSCLVGKECSYDGKSRRSSQVIDLLKSFDCIDVCPEVMGGLGCPREAHEIRGGDGESALRGKAEVVSISGKIHTKEFIDAASNVLKVALKEGVTLAVLKARSPSCGKGEIYSGEFDKKLKKGSGVTASLLTREGIKVFTDEETPEVKKLYQI